MSHQQLSLEEIQAVHSASVSYLCSGQAPLPVNQSSTSADRRGIMCLTSVFTFGKYKNKKELGQVMESDPGYIRWCLDNSVVYLSKQAIVHWLVLYGEDLSNTYDEQKGL